MMSSFVALFLFHQTLSSPSVRILISPASASFLLFRQTFIPCFISLIGSSIHMLVPILDNYIVNDPFELWCETILLIDFFSVHSTYLTSKLIISQFFFSEKKDVIVVGHVSFTWNWVYFIWLVYFLSRIFFMFLTIVTSKSHINYSFPQKSESLEVISCTHCYLVTTISGPSSQIAVT